MSQISHSITLLGPSLLTMFAPSAGSDPERRVPEPFVGACHGGVQCRESVNLVPAAEAQV